MSTEIKQINIKNYGKCVSINNGIIKIIVSVDIGPKIIFWGYNNGKNMLHIPYKIFDDNKNCIPKIPADVFFKRYGHELMLEHEDGKSSILSSGSTIYSILPDGVSFSYCISKLGINVNLEIIIQDNTNSIMVVHGIENTNIDPQSFSICSSTCVTSNGTLLVPQNTHDSGNFPNRVFSLWKKTNIKDPRLSIFNKFICFNNVKNTSSPSLKLGLNNVNAWITYTKDGITFLKHYLHNKNAKYLNFDSSFIIDSKKEILSLKILSPIHNIQKNETAKMVEYWSLFPTEMNLERQEEIEKFISTIN